MFVTTRVCVCADEKAIPKSQCNRIKINFCTRMKTSDKFNLTRMYFLDIQHPQKAQKILNSYILVVVYRQQEITMKKFDVC